ncbi:hypothetical protein RFN28_32700 [Mesorhizobium sp. VK24D]|uniref:Uncharacterized protein n=1 Tax=Mesorhizobium album TaxID=3072314 RepID=A0ABU4Y8B2_9HYPH|nr:hypothetical protein [Mesorhizobium sp. VK24D]MDX8483177.1 hypothetical protein [Mesorhizobium sp. VK24D]
MRTVDEQVAVEQLLDENGAAGFVSVRAAISILRQRVDTDLSDDELEKLVVAAAAMRRTAIQLDRRRT